ncbi:hypothetical protein AGMMS49965_00700 [Bacteroidia bacterium]|nr:hypothetical protein AGMMS49965_00700 [Bacteroidia bacterium]
MKNVKFSPWVGTKYATKGYNGKKILVLGESHYGGDYTKSDLTQAVLTHFLDYKRGTYPHHSSMKSPTTFANVLIGKQVDNATMIDFWESVVFYNFIQKVMPDIKIRPSKEDFKNSYSAFFEVLEEYKPDLIIAWGKGLWDNLPDNGIRKENKNGKSFYFYKAGDREIPAYWVYHPASSAFGYKYTEDLQEAIKLA